MIRRIVVATLTAVAATLALALFYPAPLDAQPSGWEYACELRLDFENKRRRIPGDVNTECNRIHSPPWGNWGVESPYSRRYDGYQFPGWKQTGDDPDDDGNWYQWNSCTKNFICIWLPGDRPMNTGREWA